MRTNLKTYTALVGRHFLLPGVQRVVVGKPPITCYVQPFFTDMLHDSKQEHRYPVLDCTIFSVSHMDREPYDFTSATAAESVLEEALQAISDAILWFRTEKEEIRNANAFLRQVGTTDVKYFLLVSDDGSKFVLGKNPSFEMSAEALAQLFAAFPTKDLVMTNGAMANAVSPTIRRAMSSQSLVGLGFYTEAFITMFSLLDDLLQQVVSAGMARKGLDERQQEETLRAIKEKRLEHYVTGVALLCDWKSLKVDNPDLFGKLLTVNTLRNNIMHGDGRLTTKSETMAHMSVLLDAIDWIRSNPFGYVIPAFARDNTAALEYSLLTVDPTPVSSEQKSDV